MPPLTSISPIDGRYADDVSVLSPYFSEYALMRYRILVEIEYLIALGALPGVEEFPPISSRGKQVLRSWYKTLTLGDASRIKEIESRTNHDVKAIEYFLKEKLSATPLRDRTSFLHFALTSEDINNLAYTLMWRDGMRQIFMPALMEVIARIRSFAETYARVPMLALTHGQPATPTTAGKEFAVFAARLLRQYEHLHAHRLQGKLNGATGTWGAHTVAYPGIDWITFSREFIASLGLEPNILTTQIESHDSLAESYHMLQRVNTVLLDFCRDMWLYIARGIFAQKKKDGEVGSSTMPHKINPIFFENAEGNLGIANACLNHMAEKMPVSRMQRDLSDSTVLRNQGVPLAHSLIACKNIIKGLDRLAINHGQLKKELNEHWEVLAEAIQTVLRKHGQGEAYEELKQLTRGVLTTPDMIHAFVAGLNIPREDKERLMRLAPDTYTGLAEETVDYI